MRVGIDFDNTVALYDRLLHRVAVERFGLPEDVAVRKADVRAWFWSREGGNEPWTELQGIVYGSRIAEAELAPGLTEFLCSCRSRGSEIAIISHKTEYPALGPRVNLRNAALGFLAAKGLLEKARTGIDESQVFFASTREQKIARIAGFAPDAFVDDLPEVFAEPDFPAGVRKLLFDPAREPCEAADVLVMGSWREIGDALLGAL